MISTWAASAWAAPVVEEAPVDEFARCVAESHVDGQLPPFVPGPRVAVVVGVGCVRDPRVPSLRYAARDAARVADRLERSGWSVLLLAPDATAADLRAAIEQAAAAVPEDGTVLAYWSGHGVLQERSGRVERVLGTSDLDLDQPDSGFSARELEERLHATAASHRVVIVDACFAAQPAASRPGAGFEQEIPTDPGDLRLYAAANFERADEDPQLEGSVYTDRLLAALDDPAADLDSDGCVGLVEAHVAAASALARSSSSQHPALVAGDLGEVALGDCRPRAAERALVGLLRPRPGVELGASGPGGALTFGQIGALEPGRWTISATGPDLDGERAAWLLEHWRGASGDRQAIDGWLDSRRGRWYLGLSGGWSSRVLFPSFAVGGSSLWLPRSAREWRPALALDATFDPRASVGQTGCFPAGSLRARPGIAFAPEPGWAWVAQGLVGVVGRPLFTSTDAHGCAAGPWSSGLESGISTGAQWTPSRAWVSLSSELEVIATDAGPIVRPGAGLTVGVAVNRR